MMKFFNAYLMYQSRCNTELTILLKSLDMSVFVTIVLILFNAHPIAKPMIAMTSCEPNFAFRSSFSQWKFV